MKFYRTNIRERISFDKYKYTRANELPNSYLEGLIENINSKKWLAISKRVLEERENE